MINAVECIFCKIARGQIPSDVVYQDDSVIAFKDVHPQAPIHTLIIPKKHITCLAEITKEDLPIVAHMMEVANIVAQKQGAGNSYKLVINTGAGAGQVVMHLHMHLLAGRKLSSPV
jgi:histidine triad (HIT) family protein